MRNGRSRKLSGLNQTLAAQRGHQLVGVVRIPEEHASPIRVITRRLAIALVVLFAAAVIVYADRSGYRDLRGGSLTFLDCVYFSAVSLSTTGYGDITPYTETARLVHTLIFTALRIAFWPCWSAPRWKCSPSGPAKGGRFSVGGAECATTPS